MFKVFVFASDVLPLPGLPTSGGGLRSWQLIRGLIENGLEVEYSMPKNVFLGNKFEAAIPAGERAKAWDFENQEELLERFSPDVAIWCNSPTIRVDPDWKGSTRFVADLHGPINMESVFVTGRNLEETTAELTEFLRRYDGFSCVSERQRYYWAGLLSAAGRLIDDVPFEVVPLSCEGGGGDRELPEELRLIYAGGFYPWQNCIDVLIAIGEELDKAGTGRLDLFGGVHDFSDSRRFQELFERLKSFHRVHLHGFVSREELRGYYRKASCAVDLMGKNIERELAITTRTAEYLAEGIPPIYNNYNVLSERIEAEDAGWCLDPDDLVGLRALIRDLLANHRTTIPPKSANAARIYREVLTFKSTLEPMKVMLGNLPERPASSCRPPDDRKPKQGTNKPFHKRFYYAWMALRGKKIKVIG